MHVENNAHANSFLPALACDLRGKKPWVFRTCTYVFRTCVLHVSYVCLAIWLIFDRRQHAEARTAGCKASFNYVISPSHGQ